MIPRIMTPLRSFRIRPVCVYALLSLSIGCARSPAPPSSPIVAMVDDDGISLSEFKTAFMDVEIKGSLDENSDSVKELKRNLLNQLIEQHLFLEEAGRMKLEVSPEELRQAVERIKGDYASGEFETMLQTRQTTFEDWRERLRQEILSQKVINQAVPENIQITDEEIHAYYKEHPKDFVQPEEVRARQIVVANVETATAIRQQAMQGGDFVALAKAHSLSPDKEQGGDLGYFARGSMPEEFDVVFTLGVGQISPIVKTAYGYHIFKVEERHPSRPLSPAEAADEIRAQLTQERREQLFAAWVAGLKEKARITVNDQILFQPLGPFAESRGVTHE